MGCGGVEEGTNRGLTACPRYFNGMSYLAK